MSTNKVPLPGSEKSAVEGATEIGDVDPSEKIDVTVILRPSANVNRVFGASMRVPPKKRRHLSREEFAASHGAPSGDMQKIREFASQIGLTIKDENPSRRSITLSGTAGQFGQTFGVVLKRYRHPEEEGTTFRGRTGPLYVPSELSDIILAVLGLDDRPQAASHIRPIQPEQPAIYCVLSAGGSEALRFSQWSGWSGGMHRVNRGSVVVSTQQIWQHISRISE